MKYFLICLLSCFIYAANHVSDYQAEQITKSLAQSLPSPLDKQSIMVLNEVSYDKTKDTITCFIGIDTKKLAKDLKITEADLLNSIVKYIQPISQNHKKAACTNIQLSLLMIANVSVEYSYRVKNKNIFTVKANKNNCF